LTLPAALLNDQLLTAGKKPLGFLNPWLYSTAASALNDITSGANGKFRASA
jgi:tripeptidyl-peptidase-1